MNTDLRIKVQETLDQLLGEHLIPFGLTAQKINTDAPGEYIVPFYDSRIHSFRFSYPTRGLSLDKIIRAAVLERVRMMDGPPRGWFA
jgi:hypothetical protein